MAFIAPIIIGALGITGVAATIGSAIITTALTIGAGYGLTKLLQPKPTSTTTIDPGVQLSLQMNSNAARQLQMGLTASGGSMVYWQFSGTSNDVLEMVIALNDWPSGNLLSVYVDGVKKTIDAGTGEVQDYGALFTIRYKNGDFAQTADATLITNSGGDWTSNHRLSGVAYVITKMIRNQDKFPGGIPTLIFEFEGCKLYDPRNGSMNWSDVSTWAYSNNPALVAYNWRRGFWRSGKHLYGMSTPSSYIVTSTYITGANICDELVLKKDGSTEKRYTYNALIDTSRDNKGIIENVLLSCAGSELESAGFFSFYAGAAKSFVMQLNDSDIMAKEKFRYTGKRSAGELVNTVFGSFMDPATAYQDKALPIRTNSTDVTTDGQRRSVDIKYGCVTSGTQAQRLMEIFRRTSRQQGECSCVLRQKAFVLEPGDWIQFSVNSFGWVNKEFVVTAISRRGDASVSVTLREIAASVYSYTASTDELTDATQSSVRSGAPTLTNITGLAVAPVLISVNATISRPGLSASWTAFSDETVTSILVEYRLQGTTSALSRVINDPSQNTYTWVDGVQGGAVYEVRMKLVTQPIRATNWTSWVAASQTQPQTVNVAADVPPGVIGTDNLDAQSQFELSLATGLGALQGSVGETIDDAYNFSQRAGEQALLALLRAHDTRASIRREEVIRQTSDESLASQLVVVQANIGSTNAAIVAEQEARASADSATASSLQAVTTTVNGQSVTITQLTQSVDGIQGRWGIAIDQNGSVLGLVELSGAQGVSTFTVVADRFVVARTQAPSSAPYPPPAPGDYIQVFTVGEIEGVSSVGINGNAIIDGTVKVRHLDAVTLNAIAASITTLTAVRIQSADNSSYLDFGTGEFQLTASS